MHRRSVAIVRLMYWVISIDYMSRLGARSGDESKEYIDKTGHLLHYSLARTTRDA